MKAINLEVSAYMKSTVIAAIILFGGLGLGSAMAANNKNIDRDANKILRNMSKYLASLPKFSMNADVDTEVVTTSGQKLQVSSYAKMVIDRSGKFYFHRQGMLANVALFYDGKTLTVHGKKKNVYTQVKLTGKLDSAIRDVEVMLGLNAPGADLLFSDVYAVLSQDIVNGRYMGTTTINGIKCHHLAFRKDKIDWQLWIKTGKEPLPIKYVITSKWITAAPQYVLRLSNWNTNPTVDAAQYQFKASKGATKVKSMPTNQMGEIVLTKGGK